MSKSDKKFLRSSAAWALFAGLAASPSALAQAPPEQPAPPAAEASQPEAEDEAIVVTGSRLRTEFNSASPIQVITAERAELAGVIDAAELLQSSTLASGSPQINATISSAFVTEGGPGAQTISLRGLGANRTLVLLNGRRGGPAGVRGEVSAFDLNVVPFSVVDRFEILKDGASSIYGSDAVAGVVNIITQRDLNGGQINFTGTQPFESGGEEYSIEGTWGRTFNRGYFSAAFDYYRQEEMTAGDREYTNCAEDYTFNAAGERDDRIDARTGRAACLNLPSGQIWLYEFSGTGAWAPGQPLNSPGGQVLLQWDPSGQINSLLPQTIFPAPVDASNPTAPPGVVALRRADRAVAGVIDSNPQALQDSTIIPELVRYNIFLQGGFDITPNMEAYAEVLLSRRESRTNGFRQFWSFHYTGFLGDPVNTDWGGVAIMSPTPTTDHNDSEQIVNYYRAVGGLRGEFGGPLGAFKWDVFAQGSRSDAEYTDDVILNDAVTAREFITDLCAGTNLPVSGRPCIDLNWNTMDFLAGNFTAEERAFLFDTETGTTVYDQVYLEGIMTGDILQLPAGNVGAALGFHVRRDEIVDTPGHVTMAANSWGSTTAGITAGEDTTSEVFGELGVPLLAGRPDFEELSLTLSGRYTDVESYGSAWTYKVGVNWQVSPELRFRATQGTSFRAPALFEQYLENQTSFIGQGNIDPCIQWGAALAAGEISQQTADNCAADGIPDNFAGAAVTATVITGGSQDLKAEESKAWTAGIVWTPEFIDLSVAVEYFEIEVNDEIAVLDAATIVAGCYSSPNFATEPLCTLFTRVAPGLPEEFQIDDIQATFLNIAHQSNRGIDVTILYEHEFPFGNFSAQGQFTWQLEDIIQLLPDLPLDDDNGEIGQPEFTSVIDLRLDSGDWTYFWGINFIGRASDKDIALTQNLAGTRFYKVSTEPTVYHTASIAREFDQWNLRLGVQNIFDEHPPAITGAAFTGGSGRFGTSVIGSQYDYRGRTGFITIGRKFN